MSLKAKYITLQPGSSIIETDHQGTAKYPCPTPLESSKVPTICPRFFILTAVRGGDKIPPVPIEPGGSIVVNVNADAEDVNFKDGFIHVRDSKNYESRTITIHPKLREALLALKDESRSEYVFEDRRTVVSTWASALKKSGISHCRFHDRRHTFASNLVMSGTDLVTVQKLMGHKDVRMTRRYSHPTPQHKKQAIERLTVTAMDTYLDTKALFYSEPVDLSARKQKEF